MEAFGMQQSLVTFFVESIDCPHLHTFITLTFDNVSADL
jgi:hypothetical protein